MNLPRCCYWYHNYGRYFVRNIAYSKANHFQSKLHLRMLPCFFSVAGGGWGGGITLNGIVLLRLKYIDAKETKIVPLNKSSSESIKHKLSM